ncbi:unnamed protein product [Closterium sp. Naga37s-1]|nr:unnamed protein product [Closterium sp. Naga37s-1]
MDSSGNAAAASDPQSQGTTGGTPADAAAPHNVADLTAFVQTLLQQMQARFQTMSETIISRNIRLAAPYCPFPAPSTSLCDLLPPYSSAHLPLMSTFHIAFTVMCFLVVYNRACLFAHLPFLLHLSPAMPAVHP